MRTEFVEFLQKYDEPVRLRGVVCRHYRCQECKADYYVADLSAIHL